ncbi:MAG: toprim domain-containing protein [Actinomycetota bacterium]
MAVTERRTPAWSISDVLDRVDLSSLLDELSVRASGHGPGRRWHCPMPDHDDHRASVTMFRDRQGHERWRCWSSDHRGDAIDLVVATTGRAKPDAIDWLANRVGMIHDHPLPPARPKREPSPGTAMSMDPAVAHYVRICARLIEGPQGREVRDWLHARGFDDSTIKANQIGVDPSRRTLHRPRGLPTGITVAATFPAFDPSGNLTYVQARYLNPDQAGRKYDNPAAVMAPHPRLAFPITTRLRDTASLLVCEGLPDALTAAQAGFAAVALLGAHTPDEGVAARIAAHATNCHLGITLVCDPDDAGQRVAAVLAPMLQRMGADPTVVSPPCAVDLNAWAMRDPDWADRIDNASTLEPASTDSYGVGDDL